MFISLITSKLAGPVAAAIALVLAIGLVWQSVRIDGWPLIGGGYKAQVALLQGQASAQALAQAHADAAVYQARQSAMTKADAEAGAQALSARQNQTQTRTILQKVPTYVSSKSDVACTVPWGAVRLLDAAGSGADPDIVAAAIAPGQPDDAASDVKLSEAVALLAIDLGIARENADQLTHLERAVSARAK
jgi:K+-transporting ATPase c subunit